MTISLNNFIEANMSNFQQLVKIDARHLDSLQIEASFSYKLRANHDTLGLLVPKNYRVDSYFIFPGQFNASPKDYSIDSFYRDLKSYFSLRFPKLSFKEIIGYGKGEDNAPLLRMEAYLQNYGQALLKPDDQKHILQEAKLWSCSLFYFADRKCNKLEKLIGKSDPSKEQEIADLISENLYRIRAILKRWVNTKKRIVAYSSEIADSLAPIDEYICQVLRDFILRMMALLVSDSQTPEVTDPIQAKLSAHLRLIRYYCRSHGYLWVEEKSSHHDKQEYSYRRAILKRSIWSALYIETEAQSLFKIRKQAGAMIAASFAGFWAVLAEVAIWGSGRNFRTLEGSSFIVITALTLAYVLKDRIKELGRSQFKGGIFGHIPDNRNHMLYKLGTAPDKPINVGTYSEKANYVDLHKMPKDIQQLLLTNQDTTDQKKHVICYQKEITVKHKTLRRLNLKINAVYDFFRLNLSSLIFHADDNDEKCLIPTKRLDVAWTNIPKTYKADLIIKVSGTCKPAIDPSYSHYRIVLSKQGIHSVDPLNGDLQEFID